MGAKRALRLLFSMGIISLTLTQSPSFQDIVQNFERNTQQIVQQYEMDNQQQYSEMQRIFGVPQQTNPQQTPQYPVQNKLQNQYNPFHQQINTAVGMHTHQIPLPYITQDNAPGSQFQGSIPSQGQNNFQQQQQQRYQPQNYNRDASQNQPLSTLQDQENQLQIEALFKTKNQQQNQQKQSTDIAQYFHQCHYLSSDFDSCIKDVLNQLNHFFPTGVPEYDIPPFDPFFASEVETKQSNPLMSFKLKLTDVLESGWTMSTVTGFKSDLQNNRVTIDQTWPDKRLAGGYEFEGKLFGQLTFRNKGYFNLTLLGFNQTTELTRPTGEYDDENQPIVQCKVRIQGVRDLRLHITNLLFGARNIEYVLDGIINATWRPFYPLTKPLVNELVSKAFTKIFTRAFRKVPFEYFFVA